MKLRTLLLIIMMSVNLSIIAQNEFNIGIKGGISYSGFHSGELSPYPTPLTYVFGFMGEYKLSNNLSIQSELLYTKKRGIASIPDELRDPNYYPGGSIYSFLSYTNFPLEVKYYFNDNFAAEFGPQLDVLIKEETVLHFFDNSADTILNLKPNELQFSLNLGLSHEFIDDFLLQLRYSYGLSNVYSEINPNIDGENSVLSFSIGYNFL